MSSFQLHLQNELKDPKFASRYITEALLENDADFLKIALGDVVKAYGFSKISQETGISRQSLYKMFSENGNPTHKSLVAILNVLGLEIVVRPKKKSA